MTWTEENKLDYLLRAPWTIVLERTPEGEKVLTVRELPSVAGHGDSDDELSADFWESLESALKAYLYFGDPIPKPSSLSRFPWDEPVAEPESAPLVRKYGDTNVPLQPATGTTSPVVVEEPTLQMVA